MNRKFINSNKARFYMHVLLNSSLKSIVWCRSVRISVEVSVCSEEEVSASFLTATAIEQQCTGTSHVGFNLKTTASCSNALSDEELVKPWFLCFKV